MPRIPRKTSVAPARAALVAPSTSGMTRAEWRRWVAANPDAVATAPADRVVPAELGDAVVGSAAVEAVEETVEVPAETVAAVDEVFSDVDASAAEVVETAEALVESAAAPESAGTVAEDAAGATLVEAPAESAEPVDVFEATESGEVTAESAHAADELRDAEAADADAAAETESADPEHAQAAAESGEQAADSEPAPVSAASAATTTPRRTGVRGLVRRLTGASFSVGVMGAVALLAIGTTTPGAAVASPRVDIPIAAEKSEAEPAGIQAYVTAADTRQSALDRTESYGVVSMAGLAAASGVTMFSGEWVNDPTAAVQWPFPVGVPISAAFGSQDYQAEFSTPHGGTDFTPGAGAEIHAIAAGTVRIATEAGGDYGVTVLIDHMVGGQLVSSRYGHMQYGSLQVKEGDTVQAGQVVGRVGATGKATGPHLHLEVLLGGVTKVDAVAWIRAHTS